MIRLIFTCSTDTLSAPRQRQSVLDIIRRRFHSMTISGDIILLQHDVLTILEGPEAVVEQEYDSLATTPEIKQLLLLSRETIEQPCSAPGLCFVDADAQRRPDGTLPAPEQLLGAAHLTCSDRTRRFVQEFIDGQWHHHHADWQSPQVVHRHS